MKGRTKRNKKYEEGRKTRLKWKTNLQTGKEGEEKTNRERERGKEKQKIKERHK